MMNRFSSLAAVILCTTGLLVAQSSDTTKAQSPSRSTIPSEKAQFTPEQLKDYYRVYANADVRYLRKVFDAFLRGTAPESEADLLKLWSSDYYRSKFIVMSRDENTFGGTLVTIMFQSRPDKVFIAWVYPEGESRKLTLRKFDIREFTDEDIQHMRTRYAVLLADKQHAM